MPILGGSPLGLIGVTSMPDRNGFSTFNGGRSRNVFVSTYNNANETGGGTRSILTGPTFSTISPYGNTGKVGTEDGGEMGTKSKYKGINKSTLHSNDIYDTSVLNIIEKLAGTSAALRPADFAYLKNVGVFPNNRLMIARRFATPHGDNIFGKGNIPIATMISWKPQDDDFLKITFGEEWTDAEADFKDVLNRLGEDFMGAKLGAKVGGGLGAIPLPGFTEILQRRFLVSIGVFKEDSTEALPAGDPNLIKVAKRRKTIGYEKADSGLKCSVSIAMICEWEQKFISGLDPTMVWQDIISKILTFATHASSTYGLDSKYVTKLQGWLNKPSSMITDIIKLISAALQNAKEEIMKLVSGLTSIGQSDDGKTSDDKAKETEEQKKKREDDEAKAKSTAMADLKTNIDGFMSEINSALAIQLKKYEIEIIGIANALTGAPSTPWHITLGNPMRPIFCAGDMYMSEDLSLSLGPILAFNDLPSSIKAEFTLINARPWGLQEIFAKFNAGHIRATSIILNSASVSTGQSTNKAQPIKTGSETNKTNISGPFVASVGNVGSVKGLTENASQTNTITDAPKSLTAGTGVNIDNAIATTQNTQNTISNTTIDTKTISAQTTTKIGKTGEQIVADASSTITTSQNIA